MYLTVVIDHYTHMKSSLVEMVYQLPKLVGTQHMKLFLSEYMGHYIHVRLHSTVIIYRMFIRNSLNANKNRL